MVCLCAPGLVIYTFDDSSLGRSIALIPSSRWKKTPETAETFSSISKFTGTLRAHASHAPKRSTDRLLLLPRTVTDLIAVCGGSSIRAAKRPRHTVRRVHDKSVSTRVCWERSLRKVPIASSDICASVMQLRAIEPRRDLEGE